MLENILFMTFGKNEVKRLKIAKENCISLLIFGEIWSFKITFIETVIEFICSLPNLRSDSSSALLGIFARLAENKKNKRHRKKKGHLFWEQMLDTLGAAFSTDTGNFKLGMC